jgi:hypothetical protein
LIPRGRPTIVKQRKMPKVQTPAAALAVGVWVFKRVNDEIAVEL